MRTLIVEVKHLKVRDGKNRKDKKGFILSIYFFSLAAFNSKVDS